MKLIHTCLRVRDQRDPMRAGDVDCIRISFERGPYNFQFPKHGRREEIEPCPILDQVIGDIFAAHMRCRAEPGFPIPAAPIPGRIDQSWFLGKQFFDAFEIDYRRMADAQEARRIESGRQPADRLAQQV